MRTRKRLVSFQFYPSDWLRDPDLRLCPYYAVGVYINLLCLMALADRPGILKTGGRVWSEADIVRALGGHSRTARNGLRLLVSLKLVRKSARLHTYFNARMLRTLRARSLSANAVKIHRERVRCNANVIYSSSSSSVSNSNKPPLAPPQSGGEQVSSCATSPEEPKPRRLTRAERNLEAHRLAAEQVAAMLTAKAAREAEQARALAEAKAAAKARGFCS